VNRSLKNMEGEKTRVCNVRTVFIRPRYTNLKEWCDDAENVYIGRKGIVFIDGKRYPTQDSVWHNPYKVREANGMTRQKVLALYRQYMEQRLREEPGLLESLSTLKGKRLGCWCKPEACHGDVLVELIEAHGQ